MVQIGEDNPTCNMCRMIYASNMAFLAFLDINDIDGIGQVSFLDMGVKKKYTDLWNAGQDH